MGILLGMVARECIGGPVVRRDIVKEEDTLTYKGDIADMKTIRRSGKVNNFLEDDHDPRLNASQLVSHTTVYSKRYMIIFVAAVLYDFLWLPSRRSTQHRGSTQ